MRLRADHEGFADEDASAVADGEERLGFGAAHGDGLFAEDVLASFGGVDGPGNVELVGKGIVNSVDVGVGEEFFVGAVGGGNVELRGYGAGAGKVTGGDGGDARELAARAGRLEDVLGVEYGRPHSCGFVSERGTYFAANS